MLDFSATSVQTQPDSCAELNTWWAKSHCFAWGSKIGGEIEVAVEPVNVTWSSGCAKKYFFF